MICTRELDLTKGALFWVSSARGFLRQPGVETLVQTVLRANEEVSMRISI